ncbi:MAG: tetratricopeptide repeat protein [Cryomorphaceae bacterium]|nr:MAG: tetratricopeptide repeat protein [Cryomorphaceae bacterium]
MGAGLTPFAYSQTSYLDSLKIELRKAEADSHRIYLLGRLTWHSIVNHTEQARAYNDTARILADEMVDTLEVAKALHYRGLLERFAGNYLEAITNLEKAGKLYDQFKEINGKAGVLLNLGVVFSMIGDYDRAIDYYYRQIELNEQLADTFQIGNTLNSIGSVHRKLGNYGEALAKYEEALEIMERMNKPWNWGLVMGNIGAVLHEKGDYEGARYHYKQSVESNRTQSDTWGVAYNLHRLGVLMQDLGKYDSAAYYMEQAYELRTELNQKLELAETMISLGSIWAKLGKSRQGLEMTHRGLAIADEIKAAESQTTAHKELSAMYSDMGDFRNALEHMKRYAQFRDSVLTEEKIQISAHLEARYESAVKDRRLAENELEISSANAKISEQRRVVQLSLFGAGAMLLVLILLLWVLSERRKRNLQQLLQLQKEKELVSLKSMMMGEEKERTRIARDLHDGLSGLLASIRIRFDALKHDFGALSTSQKYSSALQSLDEASSEVRRIAHNMMPEVLMKFGLVEALSEYVNNLTISGEREIVFNHYGLEQRLSAGAELVLYRVIQELLNNIVRHSRATEVVLQINRHENMLTITVEDNGVGFDPSYLAKNKGIGMQNLASRVEYLNGELNIESQPEKGTSVFIEINLSRIPKDHD